MKKIIIITSLMVFFVSQTYSQKLVFINESDSVNNFTYYTYNESFLRYDSINIQSSKKERYDFVNKQPISSVFEHDSICNIYFKKIFYNEKFYYILFINKKHNYITKKSVIRTRSDSYSGTINGERYYGTFEYDTFDEISVEHSFYNTEFHIFNEQEYLKLFSDKKKINIQINYSENNVNSHNYFNYSLEEKIISRINSNNYSIYSDEYFIIKKENNYIKFLLPIFHIGRTEIKNNIIDKQFYKMSLTDFDKLKIK